VLEISSANASTIRNTQTPNNLPSSEDLALLAEYRARPASDPRDIFNETRLSANGAASEAGKSPDDLTDDAFASITTALELRFV
jgi:hypothetical protein